MARYGERTRPSRAVSEFGRVPAAGIGVVQGYGVATGGTSSSITVGSQAYTLLTFTSDNTLTVSTAGLFDFCLVGGGGAGGHSFSNWGTSGGGGGGGVSIQTVYLTAGSWTVDIGAGGTGDTSPFTTQGKETSIRSATNLGVMVMGGGGGSSPYRGAKASSGATGGGAGNGQTGASGGSFGFAGGNGGTSGTYAGGGGGGGGAAAVGTAGSGTTGGNGGAGYDVQTFIGAGSSTPKGGGGGGGGSPAGSAGSGNGSANTGGGGDGRWYSQNAQGDSGYSGIAYVRFKV